MLRIGGAHGLPTLVHTRAGECEKPRNSADSDACLMDKQTRGFRVTGPEAETATRPGILLARNPAALIPVIVYS